MKKIFIIVSGCFSFILIFVLLFTLTNKSNLRALVQGSALKSEYPTIIIDAGHGGMDGGTVASDGTLEKDINLLIATKFNEMLKVNGFNTIMTRTEDISLHSSTANTIRAQKTSDLHNRMKIIEDNPSAIFISIHQNFFTQSKYSGAQVFYSVNNPESEILAQSIQQNIINRTQTNNTRLIKSAGTSLYLLYNAKSTAILVECGFLSNEAEAAKLKDDEYQAQMAFSIFCGLLDYLNT